MSEAAEARKRRAERRQERSQSSKRAANDTAAETPNEAGSDGSTNHGSIGDLALDLLKRAPTAIGAAAGAVAAAKLASKGSGGAHADASDGVADRSGSDQPEPEVDDGGELEQAAEDQSGVDPDEARPAAVDDARESDDDESLSPGTDATSTERDGEDAGPSRRTRPEHSHLLGRANTYAAQLTGREVDCISGFERHDGGWRIAVEVVEVPRIPSSTDVLASYELVLDDDGRLVEYRRMRRYYRNVASQEHFG